jgi:RNA polymerase sigma-70 factor, ECF subfamily
MGGEDLCGTAIARGTDGAILQSSDANPPSVSGKEAYGRSASVMQPCNEVGANIRCRLAPDRHSSGRNDVDLQTFDMAYVERLRSGDKQTEAHFIQYFSELIQLKLRSRLHSRQSIEDVRQETFARSLLLLRREGGLRQAERLGAVVNSICNNVLSEQYRANHRSEALDDQPSERFIAHEPDALSQVITEDTRRMVRRVLANLPPRDRSILEAVFLEERDRDEVCRELGVNREYIRVLLHRAKQSFREQYSRQTGKKPVYHT